MNKQEARINRQAQDDANSELILNSMSVRDPKKENVFYLGPQASRINFYSQQKRALNLVWALRRSLHIDVQQNVAVIGGGIGGLTTAAALVSTGCRVALYEKQSALCSHQLKTDKRIIHPTINFWPEVDLHHTTNLPFLNWSYGPCRSVIQDILYQWGKWFEHQVDIHLDTEITDIMSVESEYQVVKSDGTSSEDLYSAVIFASGFGSEKKANGALNLSYWSDFDKDAVSSTGNHRLAISGTGDGGVIDALRAGMPQFDRGQVAIDLADEIEIRYPIVKSQLAALEASARAIRDDEQRQSELEAAYEQFKLPTALENRFFLDTSSDAGAKKIYLLHRGSSPFDLNCAPIHRLLLHQAINQGQIVPLMGSIKSNSGNRKASIKLAEPGSAELQIGEVLIRHGAPAAQVIRDMDGDVADRLTNEDFRSFVNIINELVFPENYYEEDWGGTYYPNRFNEPEKFNDLIEYLSRSFLSNIGTRHITSAKYKSNGDHELIVRCIGSDINPSCRLPKVMFGLKPDIRTDRKIAEYESVHVASTTRDENSSVRVVRPGTRIFTHNNTGETKTSGIVTCLCAKPSKEGSVFLLTSEHLFSGSGDNTVYINDGEEFIPIGKRVFDSSLKRQRNYKSFDFASVELLPDVEFDHSPAELQFSGYTSKHDHLLERPDVTKIVDGTPMVGGRVTAIGEVLSAYDADHGITELSNLVEIEGNQNYFSSPGDSGAPVFDEFGRLIGAVMAGYHGGGQKVTFVSPVEQVLSDPDWFLISDSIDAHELDARVAELPDVEAVAVLDRIGRDVARSDPKTMLKEMGELRSTEKEIVGKVAAATLDETSAANLSRRLLRSLASRDIAAATSIAAAIATIGSVVGLGSASTVAAVLALVSSRKLLASDLTGPAIKEVASLVKVLISKSKSND